MNKYWVKWKWDADGIYVHRAGEGSAFVTTEDLENWWLDHKDECDELVQVVKL